ncbi:hypothetical protein A7K91_18820 [Paenibacillus oryzae]|uniref:Uncharacterized protein n=1 Tax=Paenibacillus oryzae TaxID=1844972 RepID=A0A1A5YRE0_9BACL|nr:hypothetical protein [Paenibacillus oryzae]OBR67985.1 hypothetical protein A7K91_18820 [Paenibacillus oryzae]
MFGILITLGIILIPFLAEGLTLFKKRWYKEAALYTLLLSLGGWFSICTFNVITLPSPFLLLKAAFAPAIKLFGMGE